MKKLLIFLLIISGYQIFAQTNNPGFSYQAVIRNTDGIALSKSKVDIVIELYTKEMVTPLFSETHKTRTDKFGQINIVIGQGETINGSLIEIPWEDGNIFYKIKIKDETNKLDIISEAQLLAVPYAYHANTANTIKNNGVESTVRGDIRDGELWTVIGNDISEEDNTLGTINRKGINIITFNKTRVEITDSGKVFFKGEITAESEASFLARTTFQDQVIMSKDLDIAGTLTVKQEGQFEQSITTLEDMTVLGFSTLNEGLQVNGHATIEKSFTVVNMSPTSLTGNLTVDGEALFNGGITAAGNLDVQGDLTVDGETRMNNKLHVEKNVADGGFVASFTNTNNGNGDGINIKLGKNRTIYTPPSIPNPLSASQVQDIKNLIRCDYSGSKVTLLGNIVIEGLQADVEMIASLAVGTFNMFTGFLNGKLGLPLDFPDIPILGKTTVFPGVHIDITVLEYDLNAIEIGPLDIDGFNLIPVIPPLSLGFLGIDAIPITDLSFWGVPNLCFNDTPGSNPLNNENEFIRFSDDSNHKMGSIRAVSLTDWSNNYLTPSYLFKLHGAITSAVDKKHGRYHFKGELTKALEDYKNIGVEYSSGNGDYAEWLERVEKEEMISAGDIVGVIGGKITRDVTNAEQVMVVSHSPIVLGNVPPAGENYKGNNIAFMGQVPVKVMGPVKTGDYIVASADIPGYGIAKSQEEMTIEDFKNAVGRSWDNMDTVGPKLVNTVVGIHNGDYSKVLEKMNEKQNENEARFDTLESKVELLSKIVTEGSTF